MADSVFMASLFTPSSIFLLVIVTIAITSRFASKKPRPQPQFGSDNAFQLFRSPSLLERVGSFNFGLFRYEPAFAETEYLQPVPDDSPQLVRTPSLLDRVKSFNFGLYRDHSYEDEPAVSETELVQSDQPACEKPCSDPANPNPKQVVRSPSLLERLRSISLSRFCKSDSIKSAEESENDDSDSDSEHDHDSGRGQGNLVKRSKSDTSSESPASAPEKMKKTASKKSGLYNSEDEETRVKQKDETLSCEGDEAVDAKADDFINRFKQQLRLQRLESFVRYRKMIKGN